MLTEDLEIVARVWPCVLSLREFDPRLPTRLLCTGHRFLLTPIAPLQPGPIMWFKLSGNSLRDCVS